MPLKREFLEALKSKMNYENASDREKVLYDEILKYTSKKSYKPFRDFINSIKYDIIYDDRYSMVTQRLIASCSDFAEYHEETWTDEEQ